MKNVIKELIAMSNVAQAEGYDFEESVEKIINSLMVMEGERILILIKKFYLDIVKNISFTESYKNSEGVWVYFNNYPFPDSGIRRIEVDLSKNRITLVVQDGRGKSLNKLSNIKIAKGWVNLVVLQDECYKEFLYY